MAYAREAKARGQSRVNASYLGRYGMADGGVCGLQTASRIAWQLQEKRTTRRVDGKGSESCVRYDAM
jgi:hypothetical protein